MELHWRNEIMMGYWYDFFPRIYTYIMYIYIYAYIYMHILFIHMYIIFYDNILDIIWNTIHIMM